MRIGKPGLFLGIYIIVSASFMQQVWAAAKKTLGRDILPAFFLLLCLAVTFLLFYKALKDKTGIYRLFLILAFCISGFIFAWRQPYVTEKMHVLEYGLLGWLSMRGLSKGNSERLKAMLCAFIFVALVSCLDEGFQKILPWRVFEVRDILTNLISGILGILLFTAQ